VAAPASYAITLQRLSHIDLDLHGAPMDIQVRLVNTNTNEEYMYMHIHCRYYIVMWLVELSYHAVGRSNALQRGSTTMIGKFACMDQTCLPRKFLTAWVSHPQCSGGQHYTL
jgi:hypothetical protein